MTDETGKMGFGCGQCGAELPLCSNCHNCIESHCNCGFQPARGFDADELGLDPETDNTPGDPSRHA